MNRVINDTSCIFYHNRFPEYRVIVKSLNCFDGTEGITYNERRSNSDSMSET